MFSISKKACLTVTALLLAFSMQVSAGQCQKRTKKPCWTPAQVSVINPIQTSPSHCDVRGVRANLLIGKNRHVTGLDCGLLVNEVTGDMTGVQLGRINLVGRSMYGYQAGWLNCTRNVKGVQGGIVNLNSREFKGVQHGLYNKTRDMTGLQWGLINHSRNLNGVQFGLINIQKSKRHLRIMPFINIARTRMPKEKRYTCRPQQQPAPCYSCNAR